MGRKTYLGGHSIVSFGYSWLNQSFELPPSKKEKMERKNKCKKVDLIIPMVRIRLLKSVFDDMGKPLSTDLVKLNTEIDNLIKAGIIDPNGIPETNHPIWEKWLIQVDQIETERP